MGELIARYMQEAQEEKPADLSTSTTVTDAATTVEASATATDVAVAQETAAAVTDAAATAETAAAVESS
eukprot:JP442485.1.p2 GENE.JP442485.1~~JP442485.1.p2  ORF type:complete len:69 (+),score=25.20 JP442485.1:1-207(+)